MKKNTRDYGKFRQNFARGGDVDFQAPAEFEDAAGNPAVGHYDIWGKLKHGESSSQELKNSLANPGRTVPNYSQLVDIYPKGSHAEALKADRAAQDNIRRTGEPSPGAGSMGTLYPGATSDFYARKKSEEQS